MSDPAAAPPVIGHRSQSLVHGEHFDAVSGAFLPAVVGEDQHTVTGEDQSALGGEISSPSGEDQRCLDEEDQRHVGREEQPRLVGVASDASDFDAADSEHSNDDAPPSSSALLFAKLTQPRVSDRSDTDVFLDSAGRKSSAERLTSAEQRHIAQRHIRLSKAIDIIGSSNKPSNIAGGFETEISGSSNGRGNLLERTSGSSGLEETAHASADLNEIQSESCNEAQNLGGTRRNSQGETRARGGSYTDPGSSAKESASPTPSSPSEAATASLRAAVLEAEKNSVATYGLITQPSPKYPPIASGRPQTTPLSHPVSDVCIGFSDSDEDPNADLSLEEESFQGTSSLNAQTHGEFGKSTSPDGDKHNRLQELAYAFADSGFSFALIMLLILVDQVFFFASLLHLLAGMSVPVFRASHFVLDCVTAVVFILEVNLRLFSYGAKHYFHSILRRFDYFICTLNASMVLASLFARQARWLLIIRYIRLIRSLTVIVMWRERRLKTQAMLELEELVVLVESERSEQNRLVKWRIDSDAIAMGDAAGHGGFGSVFLGLFRGTLVAIKQLYENSNKAAEYTSIEDEAVTLVNLRHPNVVLFMGFVHEPDKLWIVTEYCSRGSLRDILDSPALRLTQNRVLKFALGAARGLAYLHGQDAPVLHLDLKTSNILISSGWDTKLADFGLSKNIDNIENNEFAGTIQYSAPEILESNTFSVAADVYSFGICLWEMAAREVPFQGVSPMEVLWGVVKENARPPLEVIRERPREKSSYKHKLGVSHAGEGLRNSNGSSLDDLEILDELTKATSRIDAAVMVASGSLRNARRTRSRLSMPQISLAKSFEDLSVLERKANSQKSIAAAPEFSESMNLEDVFSPLSTLGGQSPKVPDLPFPAETPSESCVDSTHSFSPAHSPKEMQTQTYSRGSSSHSHSSGQQRSNSSPRRISRKIRKSMSKSISSASGFSSNSSAKKSGNSENSLESSNPSAEHEAMPRLNERKGSMFKFAKNGSAAGAADDEDALKNQSSSGRLDGKLDPMPRHGKSSLGTGSNLDVLTSKVAAKIQLFDDRPNVAKRSNVVPSLSAAVLTSKVKDALQMKISSDGASKDASASPQGFRGNPSTSSRTLEDQVSRDRLPLVQPRPKRKDTFQKRLQSFSALSAPPTRPAVGELQGTVGKAKMAARPEQANDMESQSTGPAVGAVLMGDEYLDLITRCWAQNPAQRPSADEIVWRLVSMIDGQIKATKDYDDEGPAKKSLD